MSNPLVSFIPHMINGPHNPLFYKNANIVQAAVTKMKLKPVEASQVKTRVAANEMTAMEPLWWKIGGTPNAHLHLGDKVYMLTAEQWKTFSGTLLASFQAQIGKASSISFGNALDLASALEGLTH